MVPDTRQNDHPVSFDSEQLILVDREDNEVGYLSKAQCHAGSGVLHRAFSLFIFDGEGRLLLQQRSRHKRLWPLCWSNSCCSHPRRGENMETATRRRLAEELGIDAELQYLYKFIYQAQFDEAGAEHELCWVYIGRTDEPVRANASEVADWRFVPAGGLDAELRKRPEAFTPWFRMEWESLRNEHRDNIARLLDAAGSQGLP